MIFAVKIRGIEQGQEIPVEFTCDGKNGSPEILLEGIPSGTKSLALIVEDPDAPVGLFVHWVIYGINPEVSKIEGNIEKSSRTREGFLQGKNDFGKIGYDGPCPPRGHGFHRYYFKVYALNSSPVIYELPDRKKLLGAMAGKILGQAESMGRYKR
jgi:Raf kinase inhibitor-like YbhB/YbcL family protein